MSKRRIGLWLIDTAIYSAFFWLIALLCHIGFTSLVPNGDFTFLKYVTFYLCLLIFRQILQIYRNIWRYANVVAYMKLVLADICGGALYLLISRFLNEISLGVAVTIQILMLDVIAVLCSRFLYQLLSAHLNKIHEIRWDGKNGSNQLHKVNLAIVGAGNVGATLATELLRNPRSRYRPYCFIDIDSDKVGGKINGLPVFQGDEKILAKLKLMPVQEIVIALPDATPDDKMRLYNQYKQLGCPVKIYDYLAGDSMGKPRGGVLREFKIEDLLFRDSLSVNSTKSRAYYSGKTILVTGGGGSIGSELCRQIADLHPKKLVILDIYENNAYEIQQELLQKFGDSLCMDTVIASVRDVKRLDEVFREVRPDVVFHAAAHKHVPLMERSCCEAIKNNVMGTYNTANMAEKYGVKKFVLISTDKAVNPTNVMGASKRLCEMVIQCRQDSACEFAAVRFGNVLGSNGSVIPLFRKQIAAGGPITLTDRRIIRYFMTIPEAVGLVMETGAMARNGELFVLDMGKPVKILDLAENMVRLSGLRPYQDIDIVETGLRPGEKLYEELLMKTEELDKTPNRLIFIERDKGLSRSDVDDKISVLMQAVEVGGNENIVRAIRQTVPTYHDPEEVNSRAAESEEMAQVAGQPSPAPVAEPVAGVR